MTDYWLLWMSDGNNEWVVIVEGDLKKSCMKQGIAFTKFYEVPLTMKLDEDFIALNACGRLGRLGLGLCNCNLKVFRQLIPLLRTEAARPFFLLVYRGSMAIWNEQLLPKWDCHNNSELSVLPNSAQSLYRVLKSPLRVFVLMHTIEKRKRKRNLLREGNHPVNFIFYFLF